MGFLTVQKSDEASLKSIIPQRNIETGNGSSTSNSPRCTCLRSQSSASTTSTLSSATLTSGREYKPSGNDNGGDNALIYFSSSCIPSMKVFTLYLIASLIYISCGAAIAWSSSTLAMKSKNIEFLDTLTSWFVSIFPISAALVPQVVFKTYSYVSARTWVSISSFLILLSWLMLFVIEGSYGFLITRSISGLGTGLALFFIPVYLSHFITESSKSRMEQFLYGMLMLGAILEYFMSSNYNMSLAEYATVSSPDETLRTSITATTTASPTTLATPISTVESTFVPAVAAVAEALTQTEANIDLPMTLESFFPYVTAEFFMLITSFITFLATLLLLPQSPQTLVHRQQYAEARCQLEQYVKNDDDDVVAKMQCWAVKEKRDQHFMQIFEQKSWVERLVPVFGLVAFDALLAIIPMMFFLNVIVDATGGGLSDLVKILLFCLASVTGCLYGPKLLNGQQSKRILLLSITLLFFVYITIGTYFHLKSLAVDFISEASYVPAICFTLIGFIYFGIIKEHIEFFSSSLTSRANRFPVRAISHTIMWLIVASISHNLNHAIWYIGVGWIFYNIAIVCLFYVLFVAFVLPHVSKSVVVIDIDSDGSELSSHSSTSRSSSTQTDSDISADVTMDAILIA